MRLRACIALLLYVSACATSAPSPEEPVDWDPRYANLQRAAKLPWTDGGRCAVREASEPWPVLAERCYQALDHDRLEFHDLTGRCSVASAGAAAMGLGVCVLAAPEIIVGAVVVAGVVVVGFAISEALEAYEKRGRPQVRPGAEMTEKRKKMTLIVYAPALVGDDSRPVAVVHGMERVFPGPRLGWTTSLDGQRTLLANRDAWLAQQRMDREFPLLHNGDERAFVSVYGTEAPATSSPGGQAQLEIHAKLPLSPEGISAAADVLEAVAETARAYWGHATPSKASLDIARQTKNRPDDLEPPPRGLPMIKSPGAMRSPEIPHRLGWLSYWSAAAARAIGFPDPSRDAELLSRSRRTATGGWVVQLTDAPLDLDNPAHLDALKRAYERFPEIGGRSAS